MFRLLIFTGFFIILYAVYSKFIKNKDSDNKVIKGEKPMCKQCGVITGYSFCSEDCMDKYQKKQQFVKRYGYVCPHGHKYGDDEDYDECNYHDCDNYMDCKDNKSGY